MDPVFPLDLDDMLYALALGIEFDIMKNIQFQDHMAEKLGVGKSGALPSPLQAVRNQHGRATEQCWVCLWQPRQGADAVWHEFGQRSNHCCACAHSCMAGLLLLHRRR